MISEAELHQQADDIIYAIASIKEQIARAKSSAAQTGDYADTDWFHRANRALRHKQAAHQILLREIGFLSASRRQVAHVKHMEQQPTFEREFIRAAQRKLDEATLKALMDEAQQATHELHSEAL